MLFEKSLLSKAAILALVAPIHASALHKPRQAPGPLDCSGLDDLGGTDGDIPGLQYPATCTTLENMMPVTSVKPAADAPLTRLNAPPQPSGGPIAALAAPPPGGPVYNCDEIDDDDNTNNGSAIVYPATCTTDNNGMVQTSVRNAADQPLTSLVATAPPLPAETAGVNAPPPAQGMVYDCDDVDDDVEMDGDVNNDNENGGGNGIDSATLSYPLTCTTQSDGGAIQTYIRSASGAAFASATPGATDNSGTSSPAPTTGNPAPTGTAGNNDNAAQPSSVTGAAAAMATAGFREAALGGAAVVIGAIAFGL